MLVPSGKPFLFWLLCLRFLLLADSRAPLTCFALSATSEDLETGP